MSFNNHQSNYIPTRKELNELLTPEEHELAQSGSTLVLEAVKRRINPVSSRHKYTTKHLINDTHVATVRVEIDVLPLPQKKKKQGNNNFNLFVSKIEI